MTRANVIIVIQHDDDADVFGFFAADAGATVSFTVGDDDTFSVSDLRTNITTMFSDAQQYALQQV